MDPRLDVRLNERLLRGAVNAFVRKHGARAADRAVRKIAFDVGGYVTRALNGDGAGYPHPKRIDTGRYRASWNVAIEAATGRSPGPTVITPPRNADGTRKRDERGRFLKGAKAGSANGHATWSGRGLARSVTITNAVEYGPYVEFGTAQMAPGLHLTRGLKVVAKDVYATVGKEVSDAWGR